MITLATTLSDFSQQVIIFLLVVAAKNFYHTAQPWLAVRQFAALLAKKVNKPQNGLAQQQIAGGLAFLLIFLPIMLIVTLFENLVAVPQIWQALLLFFALDAINFHRLGRALGQDLVAGQKYQAKQKLQPWVLRDCKPLSTMGMVKAFLECQILRWSSQFLAITIAYFTFGGAAAIAVRLTQELHFSWNNKCQNMQYFGRFAQFVSQFILWLPQQLTVLLLWISNISKHSLLYWRLSLPLIFQFSSSALVQMMSFILGVKLGGVAMYQNQKLRRKSFNDMARQPEIHDIISGYRKTQSLTLFVVAFLVCSAILTEFLGVK